jgi:hypothetical protein
MRKGTGKGAAAPEPLGDAAQASLSVFLTLMRARFDSVSLALGELESADKAVGLMREFLDSINVKLMGIGTDLDLGQLAKAGEQAVEKIWIDTAKTKGDLTHAMMALNEAATQTQIMAAKVEKEAADDKESGGPKKKKGKTSHVKETGPEAAAADAGAADAGAAEKAREAKELADKRKAAEAGKKRRAMEEATKHAEPEKMSEFLKKKGVADIQKKVLPEGGTIMEIMDACNFDQQKLLLSLAVLFDFGHASGSTEGSEDEGFAKAAANDARRAAGAGGEDKDVSIVATFSIELKEAKRSKVTECMQAGSPELKQFMEAAIRAAGRGNNPRKQYVALLKEFEGADYVSFESFKNATLMSTRSEREMLIVRAIKSAQRDASLATTTLIQGNGFIVCDVTDPPGSDPCRAARRRGGARPEGRAAARRLPKERPRR